jgi:hypothetical protein
MATFEARIYHGDIWTSPVTRRDEYESLVVFARRYVATCGGAIEIRDLSGALWFYLDDTGREWLYTEETATPCPPPPSPA